MSSDEDDYMSDKFLESMCKETKNTRPGLVTNHSKKREYELEKRKATLNEDHKRRQMPAHKVSEVQLKAGLSTAISSDNKGFAMLAKMGYKQGDSLGKQNTGIVEPIPIEVKNNRGGLGREAAMKELQEYRASIRRKRIERQQNDVITPEEYRRRKMQESQMRQIEGDLRKSQKSCEKLDEDNQVEEPAMKWFWPERKQPKKKKNETDDEAEEEDPNEEEEEEEEPEDYEPSEKLEMITNYLRTTYCYCVWCGVKYENNEDMQTNCPGNTKDDH